MDPLNEKRPDSRKLGGEGNRGGERDHPCESDFIRYFQSGQYRDRATLVIVFARLLNVSGSILVRPPASRAAIDRVDTCYQVFRDNLRAIFKGEDNSRARRDAVLEAFHALDLAVMEVCKTIDGLTFYCRLGGE
jgi:hypothetical protein